MIDENKKAQYNSEMLAHANGAAQFLSALIGGRYVTREQASDMADYVLAKTKKDIESNPFASQEEKNAEIRRRENLVKILKSQTGL